MENKFSKNRILINGHFGVAPKIPAEAWKEVAECAKKVTAAVARLTEVAKKLKIDNHFKQ